MVFRENISRMSHNKIKFKSIDATFVTNKHFIKINIFMYYMSKEKHNDVYNA